MRKLSSKKRSNKSSQAAKKAWVTIRLNKELERIKWQIAGLKAYETRLKNQAAKQLRKM